MAPAIVVTPTPATERNPMRISKRPWRLVAGSTAVVLASMAMVALGAAPANATVPTVVGSATCDTVTGEWTIDWTIGGDTDPAYAGETATIVTQSRVTDTTLVGQSVKGAGTVTESEKVTATGTYTQTVEVQWTNHAAGDLVSKSGSVNVVGVCAAPVPNVAAASVIVTISGCLTPAMASVQSMSDAVLQSSTGTTGPGLATFTFTRTGTALFPAGDVGVSGDRLTKVITVQLDGADFSKCVTSAPCTSSVTNFVTPDNAAALGWETEDGAPLFTADGLHFVTTTSAAKVNYFNGTYATPLLSLSNFEYTVKGKTGELAQASLKLEGLMTGVGGYATLSHEAYINNGSTPGDGTFHTYPITDSSLIWSSKIANPNPGSQSSPQTLLWFKQNYPAGLIRVGLGQGSGNAGADSYVKSVSWQTADGTCRTDTFGIPAAPAPKFTDTTVEDAPDCTVPGDGKVHSTTTYYQSDPSWDPVTAQYVFGTPYVINTVRDATPARAATLAECPPLLLANPPAVAPGPPDCKFDGSLPTLAGGPHYTTTGYNRPDTGAGTYTAGWKADKGYTFATGTTWTQDVTTEAKLPASAVACLPALAYTAAVLPYTPYVLLVWVLGSIVVGLVLLGIALATTRRLDRRAAQIG